MLRLYPTHLTWYVLGTLLRLRSGQATTPPSFDRLRMSGTYPLDSPIQLLTSR